MKSSRMLPIAALVVIIMLGVVLFFGRGNDDSGVMLDAVPQALPPDADTPADTIKTLTAKVAAMTAQVEALHRDHEQLREHDRSIEKQRDDIEADVLKSVTRLLAELEKTSNERNTKDLEQLITRMDELARMVERASGSGASETSATSGWSSGHGSIASAMNSLDDYIWIDPLDSFSHVSTTLEPAYPFQTGTGQGRGAAKRIPQKVYTVPRNSTLIDAKALTALIGRVPTDGQIHDPMPFKVLTGNRNLIANGHELPHLEGMVWSGTAMGDWTLSCVSGTLESATFVFTDGTVQTVPDTGSVSAPIAWISDSYGLPCIPGTRSTNFRSHLGSLMGVDLVNAAAQATADAQITESLSPLQDARRSVTGNIGRYVLGETIASGSQELAGWMAVRSNQEFDAVVVPAGQSLSIHVDRELHIDITPNARKLNHEESIDRIVAGGVD